MMKKGIINISCEIEDPFIVGLVNPAVSIIQILAVGILDRVLRTVIAIVTAA